MSDDSLTRTVSIRRPKISTDDHGRSVWSEPVETVELELVSTQILQQILQSDDATSRSAIEQAAQGSNDGVLARDTANGQFEIIDNDDLQAILDDNKDLPAVSRPSDVTLVPLTENDERAAEELSLVSTQALRKILKTEDDEPEVAADIGGGFDPYNSG